MPPNSSLLTGGCKFEDRINKSTGKLITDGMLGPHTYMALQCDQQF